MCVRPPALPCNAHSGEHDPHEVELEDLQAQDQLVHVEHDHESRHSPQSQAVVDLQVDWKTRRALQMAAQEKTRGPRTGRARPAQERKRAEKAAKRAAERAEKAAERAQQGLERAEEQRQKLQKLEQQLRQEQMQECAPIERDLQQARYDRHMSRYRPWLLRSLEFELADLQARHARELAAVAVQPTAATTRIVRQRAERQAREELLLAAAADQRHARELRLAAVAAPPTAATAQIDPPPPSTPPQLAAPAGIDPPQPGLISPNGPSKMTVRRVLRAMIQARTATGDTEAVTFLQHLYARYRRRELDSAQVRRRLIKRLGRACLEAVQDRLGSL